MLTLRENVNSAHFIVSYIMVYLFTTVCDILLVPCAGSVELSLSCLRLETFEFIMIDIWDDFTFIRLYGSRLFCF